jgi:hypothetical protein
MALFQVLRGTTPATLHNEVALTFDLPVIPAANGILFYMIDTRHGERTYEIVLNGTFQDKIVLPTGNYLATLNIEVKNLKKEHNVLRFVSLAGNQQLQLNILNVVLLYGG